MLAGKSVKIRFRQAADDNTGDFGWALDNLQFQGITNTPFPSVINDASVCSVAMIPIANAGPDQTVFVGNGVILDGSMSSSPGMLALGYEWTQTAGFIVKLSNPNIAKPTWVAPPVVGDTTFTFNLKVSDANGSATDSVNVLV